ncbi:unnamed protein product [Microthlaspi erraticum]|uniref:Reverse transcriptase zinc-binding domain-containing protein n=1 Tax=Microthlaspi erraticum TaxID=1685480 RepID=A0A6D2LAL6_9BRAS|nr:unnamed protein product [Microthlaspi erraticum]
MEKLVFNILNRMYCLLTNFRQKPLTNPPWNSRHRRRNLLHDFEKSIFLHCLDQISERSQEREEEEEDEDLWSCLGPLEAFLGAGASRQLRVNKQAAVVAATRNGSWNLPAARSHSVETLHITLTSISPPQSELGPDRHLWIQGNGDFGDTFSSKVTWELLRNPAPIVPWSPVVWFKEHVPRNSFIAWLALLRRLPTRDRLRRWGMSVPETCVLCSSGIETHHHLFFECAFSSSIWSFFASRVFPSPPADLHSAASWIALHRAPSSPSANPLIKLIFQASIYLIWKEQNQRIFKAEFASGGTIRRSLDRFLRDRLLSFPTRNPLDPSMLEFYFTCIRPP